MGLQTNGKLVASTSIELSEQKAINSYLSKKKLELGGKTAPGHCSIEKISYPDQENS